MSKVEYREMYPWDVVNAISEGRRVYFLDRERNAVYSAGSVEAAYLVEAIKYEGGDRFLFWEVVENETDAL